VRRWLRWASFATCGAAIAIGCGSSGSGTSGFDLGDSGQGGDSSSSSGSASSSGGGSSSGSSSGSFGDSGGNDATTGSSTSSGGGPGDATLDIAFPDSFYGPEGSSSGSPDSTTGDGATACTPSGVTCQGNVADICSAGTLTTTNCAALTPPKTCANGFGCVVCQPGTGTCSGSTGTACNSTGTATTTYVCDPLQGETCDTTTGQCDGDCANVGSSYIGCEYYAITMSNSALDQTTFYASLSLSNTSANTASISIIGPNATNVTDTIAAGALKEYHLPWVHPLSCSSTCNGVTVSTPTTALVAGGAYHIRTTEPVTAYQFNARDYQIGAEYSYTNDASLLIPVNAMTGNYRVVAGATWYFSPGAHQYPGNVDIVGTVNGTQVTYTAPSGNTVQAGGGLATTGGTVTLNQGDVLQIAATGNGTASAFGSDQTGALVSATQPVEVFGGTDCTYMPAATPACDHIEEINFPLETLRSDYLVTLPNNTNGTPQQYIKIVGTVAGTTLTYDPAVAGAPATLGAGQMSFFKTTQNFHVMASQPVFVGQFMESENNFAMSDTAGDPALSAAVATAQFRASYQFISPANYEQNWVNVIAPTGAQVTVDGAAVTGFAAIGGSGYGVAHVSLCGANAAGCTGVHNAASSAAFGIEVYGYGSYTSYMYPGGLNLTRQ
jgi:hypothetical protein